jgi:hypothetical protein
MECLVAAAFGLVVAITAQVAALRARGSYLFSCAVSVIVGAVATAAAIKLMSLPSIGDLPWRVLTALALFGSWWFVLLNFIQTSISSLRVQILREVIAAGGAISRDALLSRYNDDLLVRLRLKRLIDGGTVTEKNQHLFVISGPLRWLARLFRILKILMTGHASEFSQSRLTAQSVDRNTKK